MAEMLLVQTGEGLPSGLREAIAAASDLSVAAPETAYERIAADPDHFAAVVLGVDVQDPVAWVQRFNALDPGLSVVVLATAETAGELRRAVRLVPNAGEDVACVEVDGGVERVAQVVAEAGARRRQRQAYARVASAVNERIAQVAAPPPIAADFGRLLDRAPIGVVTVDPQGAIHGCNRQAEGLLGFADQELSGYPLPLLFSAEDRTLLRDYLARAVQGTDGVEPAVYDRCGHAPQAQYLELSAIAVEIGPKQAGAIVLLQDVTQRELTRQERDRTEEALRQQRRWYEATVLGIGDGVIATNEHGRVTLMNAVAEQLTGWSQADASGLDCSRVFHIVDEATSTRVESPVARVLRDGAAVGLANHTILIARDGRRRSIDDSGAPIRDDKGLLVGVVLVFRDVSERRRSERALRESEQRFRAVFEQAAAGIAVVAPEARILEVNQRFCELVGYSAQELLAMDDPIGALTHPDDLDADRERSRALAAGEGPPYQLEKRYIHREGHAVWVRLTASALRDEADHVQQLIGVVEDIGERKRAESALKASEEHLRLILESLRNHGVFTLDLEGRIDSWNRGAERLLGYTESEIVGQPAEVIFTDADRRARAPHRELQSALEHGQAADRRWHVRKDGHSFWASGVVNPLLASSEQPRGFVKILRDETESKRAQEQLEARARQQAAVASLGQRALAGTGVEQLLDEAARVVAQTLDVELAKVLRLLPAQGRLRVEAGVGWPEGTVGHVHVEGDLDSQAGYTLHSDAPVVVEDLPAESRFSGPLLLRDLGVMSGMSVVIAGDREQPWGVLGAHSRAYRQFTDDDVNFLQAVANIVAEAIGRTRTEQRLRELNQTLEQRVAERTAETEQRAAQLRALTAELTQTEQRERRRLAQVLHDHLQQMLVAAKFQLGMASKGISHTESASALERVGELLDKSIRESRSLTVELSPPVLYEAGLVAGLEWLSRWMQAQHGLRFELHTTDDVEPGEEDVLVLLFQTARELLFNVAKHAGTDRAEVYLRRDAHGCFELEVCDRGEGFVANAVEPSDEGKQAFGLFSIRERFARLGGELHVESTPGAGTRVKAALPEPTSTAREARASEWTTIPAPEPETAGASGKRVRIEGVIRVILADDHTIVREGLLGVLSGLPDIEVVGEAADGQAAVELARQERPDVAVLDITMPRMNGIDAARMITEEFPDTRVIGLSVHDSSDMAAAMRKAGASVYLNKAGPSSRLLAAIRGQQT